MNIGATIKKLRREKDITQEQLAEFLGVSAQAVSRWETGAALPDITQVPVLANIFDISADALLGIDIAAKEARIQAIIDDAYWQYTAKGYPDKALEILRTAIKEYPNSYKLMGWLASTIWTDTVNKPQETAEEKAAYQAAMAEAVTLGETVLAECTDTETRNYAIQFLCYAYRDVGETDKAIALAKKMPEKFSGQEALLAALYKGSKLYELKQNNLTQDLDAMLQSIASFNVQLDDGSYPYTREESILLRYKILDMYRIVFEDENYGFYHERLYEVHRDLAALYTRGNDANLALQHLKAAMKHALAYDASYVTRKDYTCLLLRGYRYGSVSSWSVYNAAHELLEAMGSHEFDPTRHNPEFVSIEAELHKHAGKHMDT
ncbi:MAG: helix-turn-helix domain-containing protein [Defluviitaleaceae bacterium]|nr:helix-turn-helix domain-containing protein [Defluviitaleaceae bacterium]